MHSSPLSSKISPQKDLSSQAEDERDVLCYEEDISTDFTDIDRLSPSFTESMGEEQALFLFNRSDGSSQRQLEGDIGNARGGAGSSQPQPWSFGLGRSVSGRLDSEAMAGFLSDHETQRGDEPLPGDNRFSKRPRREETRTDEALQSSLICHESLPSQDSAFSLIAPRHRAPDGGRGRAGDRTEGGAGPSHPQPLSFDLNAPDPGGLYAYAGTALLSDHETQRGDETIPEDNREDNRFSKHPRTDEVRPQEALQRPLIGHATLPSRDFAFSPFAPRPRRPEGSMRGAGDRTEAGMGPSHPQPLSFDLNAPDPGGLYAYAGTALLNGRETQRGDETIPEDNREDNRFSKHPRTDEVRPQEALQRPLIGHATLPSQEPAFSLIAPRPRRPEGGMGGAGDRAEGGIGPSHPQPLSFDLNAPDPGGL